MHLGLVKGERLINLLNRIALFFGTLYIFCMLVYPWINGEGSWSHVHTVWMDWQAFNVGILAFSSSLIAFNISRYHANEQRAREFIAARSFLPEALSELISYFKSSSIMLTEAWERVIDKTEKHKTPLTTKPPELPANYREVFSRCISLAKPEVANYLSYILMRLQVHHARIIDLGKSFEPDSPMFATESEIISYLYRLAELQALIGKIFDYSRGLEEFKADHLNWDDFNNAYGNLDIWLDEFNDLEGFTKRAIERSNKAES